MLSSLKILSQAGLYKDFDTIPSVRPIVSANGSVTEILFIDHHIKPHVSFLPSYVQDDMDFICKIESVNADCSLPPNLLLCTMDMFQHSMPIFQHKKV